MMFKFPVLIYIYGYACTVADPGGEGVATPLPPTPHTPILLFFTRHFYPWNLYVGLPPPLKILDPPMYDIYLFLSEADEVRQVL